MESQQVLSIDYSEDPASPWPRIVRIIALLMVVYGALSLASGMRDLRMFWKMTRGPAVDPDRNLALISQLLQMGIYAFLVAGAAMLLKRQRSPGLLLAALWTWIGLYAVGMGIYLLRLAFNPPSDFAGQFVWMLLLSARESALPLLIILLLRQQKQDRRSRAARQFSTLPLNPASHDVQTPTAALR